MSVNYQQRENLIVVEAWAANNWPSIQKAVCINRLMEDADEDGGWEDIEEDEEGNIAVEEPTIRNVEENTEMNAKRQKLNDSKDDESALPSNKIESDDDEPDSYLAYLNPDVLHEFLNLSGIQSDEMHEGTAFFLLMTFPFYEQEWDLVGYLLEEVFGDGGED